MAQSAELEYQLLDEPSPGRLSRLAVDPFWPVLSLMMAGAWVGWPWMVLNSFAIGSATKLREFVLTGAGVALSLVLVFAIGALHGAELLPQSALPYAAIMLPAVKMALAFVAYRLQARSFELYEYYGGLARNGLVILIVAVVARGALEASVAGFWRWMLL